MSAWALWCCCPLLVVTATVVSASDSRAHLIRFSGELWEVRDGLGGPGPNHWSQDLVRVDDQGALHLRLAPVPIGDRTVWCCAEVHTRRRFGFGRFDVQVEGPIDHLDPQVVMQMFTYPLAPPASAAVLPVNPAGDVTSGQATAPEPDGTNEIDIEFSRWGDDQAPIGNYSVWPEVLGLPSAKHPFPFRLGSSRISLHQIDWQPQRIRFQSGLLPGEPLPDDVTGPVIWSYSPPPAEATQHIPQGQYPFFINLWSFRGLPPRNDHPVEVVVRSFHYDATVQTPIPTDPVPMAPGR